MKALIPLVFVLVGTGIGAGAGMFLAPKPEPLDCEGTPCAKEKAEKTDKPKQNGEEKGDADYLRLQNQFVVPVVRDELVSSLVVMSISLEIAPNSEDYVYEREPKLRDVLLQVLFDHAYIGGFDGTFTESSRLTALRVALLEGAQSVLGDRVSDILITDIVRQEL